MYREEREAGRDAHGETEQRAALLAEALRSTGLRLTHQRLEVAREIARADTHPDAESIYEGVRERVPTISLDTVYRTLATLTTLGVIKRVGITPGPARYDSNVSRHQHFVCVKCGRIADVSSPSLDNIKAPEQTRALGRVESVEVQLRGVCKECQQKEQPHDER